MPTSGNDVLVLDAEQRSALAVVRSLGRRGIRVFTAASQRYALAGASRFSRCHTLLSDPLVAAGPFLNDLRAVSSTPARQVWPLTDTSLAAISDFRGQISATIAGAPPLIYEAASRKDRLISLAQKLGIPVPRSVCAVSINDIRTAVNIVGYPAVLKPALSRWLYDGRVVATSVSIVCSAGELERQISESKWAGILPCVVQEWVEGKGAGIFSLYGPQGPVAWFSHRRLREKPPRGGVSVLCESVATDPTLKQHATRLLDALEWSGVAMVEFRIAPDGRPYLMEINGRFWGSLQLAIDSGVDFPWLQYQLLSGNSVAEVTGYNVGRRLRWFLGDVDNLWLQLKDAETSPAGKLAASARFLASSADLGCRNEILRVGDLYPAVAELRQWIGNL